MDRHLDDSNEWRLNHHERGGKETRGTAVPITYPVGPVTQIFRVHTGGASYPQPLISGLLSFSVSPTSRTRKRLRRERFIDRFILQRDDIGLLLIDVRQGEIEERTREKERKQMCRTPLCALY